MFESFDKTLALTSGLILIYLIYKLFQKSRHSQNNIETEYNNVLNSDKYKVKSQWENQ